MRDGSCWEEEDGDHGIPPGGGGTDTDIFGCLPSFILSLMDMGKWYTVKVTALLLLGCLDIYNRCIRFLFQPHRKHKSVKKAVGKFVYNCFFSLKAASDCPVNY